MRWRLMNILRFPYSFKNLLFPAIAVFLVIAACTSNMNKSSFDPRNCFEIIPKHVEGLKILAGQRTEKSIIRDMVPIMCNGHALFKYMKSKGKEMNPGTIIFRVVVEYTGEVQNVIVEETTVQSEAFIREVSDFIMDTDFVFWARHDTDTVFLYPAKFGY